MAIHARSITSPQSSFLTELAPPPCVATRTILTLLVAILTFILVPVRRNTAVGNDGRPAVAQQPATTPEARAVGFLSREVTQWPTENHCFSCHNNGDAARALYQAEHRGLAVPKSALATTTDFLANPDRWDKNESEPAFKDTQLATIQFASGLRALQSQYPQQYATALQQAAELVVKLQQPDGSWKVGTGGLIGSPATYGQPLATVTACNVLRSADADKYRIPLERAQRWLRSQVPKSVLDSAVIMGALADVDDPVVGTRRKRALSLISQGQADSGGWGPYRNSYPEPFDTAIVLLNLKRLPACPELSAMISKGRQFLIASQRDDGSWIETTRPPDRESYAQRLSTTGWATLALLETQPTSRPD